MSHSVAKSNDFLPLRFSLAWTSRACDSFQFSYRRGCGFELGQWMLGGCWEEGDFCRVHKARWELSCREQSWDEWAAVWGSRKHSRRVWMVMESKNNLVTISWGEGELQWPSFRGELGGKVLLEEDKATSGVGEWAVQGLCLCHTDALSINKGFSCDSRCWVG